MLDIKEEKFMYQFDGDIALEIECGDSIEDETSKSSVDDEISHDLEICFEKKVSRELPNCYQNNCNLFLEEKTDNFYKGRLDMSEDEALRNQRIFSKHSYIDDNIETESWLINCINQNWLDNSRDDKKSVSNIPDNIGRRAVHGISQDVVYSDVNLNTLSKVKLTPLARMISHSSVADLISPAIFQTPSSDKLTPRRLEQSLLLNSTLEEDRYQTKKQH